MDKLESYRSCIEILLEKYAQFQTENKEVENQLFFDPIRNHYQFMRVGWKDLERIYYTVLHFDIKYGKILLQQNATESDVGQELIEMGVDKEDIVLGLHPPYKRPYTGYGVA
ncbi:MAG: XisI protein [Okeania sp. SIO2C9]|uniref:XisI protein n=1 Tax=Okeania sp. SIO2C9 TaxID=2607791 RepID=UPI0013C2567C|nr:XisI protein [Okeania sp. SIO2C9]NEQ73538.1 XisI protein [Okeania sp. SIO2C9]